MESKKPGQRAWKKFVPWTVVGGYAIIIGVLIYFHEPWFDEVQAWLIARDASLSQLFWLAGYEGSPVLWHLLLMPLAKLGVSVVALQVTSYVLAVSAAALLIRFGPFSLLQKVLILLSYPFLYEYAVIARSYILGIVLLFVVATLWKQREKYPWWLALSIVGLANVSLFSLWIAICLAAYWVVELSQAKQLSQKSLLTLLATGAGLLFVVVLLIPPADLSHLIAPFDIIFERSDIEWLSVIVSGGFFPIPDPGGGYWNNVWWSNGAVLSIGLFAMVISYIAMALRSARFFYLYLIMSGGVIMLFMLKHMSTERHLLMLPVIFLFCYWLAQHERPAHRTGMALSSALVTSVFILQLPTAAISVGYDLTGVFAEAEVAAADLQQDPDYQDIFLLSFPAQTGAGILPFIADEHQTIYGVELQKEVSYITWNSEQSYGTEWKADQVIPELERVVKERQPKKALIVVDLQETDVWRALLAKYPLYGNYTDELLEHEDFVLIDVTAAGNGAAR